MGTILLFSTSGGSGHIQTAKAKREELLEENPHSSIVDVDLIREWWGPIGYGLLKLFWDIPQKKGYVRLLKWTWRRFSFAEKVFFIPCFCGALRFFLYHDVERIVASQPFSFPALIAALKCAKFVGRKMPVIETIFIEMPTSSVNYYYHCLRRLPMRHRHLIQLHALPPLLQHEESEADFWLKYAGLPFSAIRYIRPPIRKSFYMALQNSSLSFANIDLQEGDQVLTLMLGSQPTAKAILAYLDALKAHPFKAVFILCASDGKLKKKIEMNYPRHMVALSPQPGDVIAKLLMRSNYTITRSGAITSMELYYLSNGQILIHSETGDFEGMPEWEAGNALYLMKKKGARLVTPHTLSASLHSAQTAPTPLDLNIHNIALRLTQSHEQIH